MVVPILLGTARTPPFKCLTFANVMMVPVMKLVLEKRLKNHSSIYCGVIFDSITVDCWIIYDLYLLIVIDITSRYSF